MMLALGVAANTDDASLACLPFTSCCAAWFPISHGWVLVCSQKVGDSYARL